MVTPPFKLLLWTIYNNPVDFPGQYVARQFVYAMPTDRHFVGGDLESVREYVKTELLKSGVPFPFCMQRHPDDEPQILETWC